MLKPHPEEQDRVLPGQEGESRVDDSQPYQQDYKVVHVHPKGVEVHRPAKGVHDRAERRTDHSGVLRPVLACACLPLASETMTVKKGSSLLIA